ISYIAGDEKFVEVLKTGDLVIRNDRTATVPNDSNAGVDDHDHEREVESPSQIVEQKDSASAGGLGSDAQAVLEAHEARRRQIQEDAERNDENILKAKENDYLFKGWVGRLGRVIGRKATHTLYKTENDDLCHMISNNPELKLEDYA